VGRPPRNFFDQCNPRIYHTTVVDAHDVGVVQTGERLHLLAEAQSVGRISVFARPDDLERNIPVQVEVEGPVDRSHAPFAEAFEQLKGSEAPVQHRHDR
jgi:hypothetical protein